MARLCHRDALPVQMKTVMALTIGLLTQIEHNLNLPNSFTPKLKCQRAILISWWRAGQRMGLNVVKNRPSSITRTFTKPLTPPPLVLSLGNPSAQYMMVTSPRKVKSLHGWRQNIQSGFATHVFSSAISYQTPMWYQLTVVTVNYRLDWARKNGQVLPGVR